MINSVTSEEVVEHHREFSKAIKTKRFAGRCLGYVTPWNSRGYKLAKVFAAKFSHLVPVWFQVDLSRANGSGKLKLGGRHEVDREWMKRVRARGALVLPRVNLEGVGAEGLARFLGSRARIDELVALLAAAVEEYGLDGLTLETGGLPGMRIHEAGMTLLVEQLAGVTRVIMVAPPAHPAFGARRQRFDYGDLAALAGHLEGVSVMTYDFSHPGSPGPSAPLAWMERALEGIVPPNAPQLASKVFLGLNFYGNDFAGDGSGGPIIEWDSGSSEHVYRYVDGQGREHEVWYPSLGSLHVRLELAARAGVGVAVWELGQGLDYLFDEL
ncbi:Cc1-9 [Thecamonas trahens ATCC 50062]|uniref:Chitinase domain-containing protein 1 n=1 Tax=Thecamonas trahens ATCC 50062 TaxID=461836 RepID=A0A0L0DV90_THETB|nr:Cc1-9 [Thecamonas trahens ATCC 50062]KNC55463.1 Cc1-9 [Thecamonas trahens ATCC 50062]|eukprot:XP_013761244.1 Cc1-9 [Thecamonas trahens ATCC 50062]